MKNYSKQLLGVISLIAFTNCPSFAGTYQVTAPDYKVVNAAPAAASASLPALVRPQTKSDAHYDPEPVNGIQSLKISTSTATAIWVPDFVGETATAWTFKHDYDVLVSMNSHRNNAHAEGSTYGESYLTAPKSSFSSSVSGANDTTDDGFQYASPGIGNLHYNGGDEFEVFAMIGAKASTNVYCTPGGTVTASASVKVTTRSISK